MGVRAQRRVQAAQAVRPVLVRGEVGAVHSSGEAANHRGAKGPHLVEVDCEAKDWRWLSPGMR
jgi:hypothetical protein